MMIIIIIYWLSVFAMILFRLGRPLYRTFYNSDWPRISFLYGWSFFNRFVRLYFSTELLSDVCVCFSSPLKSSPSENKRCLLSIILIRESIRVHFKMYVLLNRVCVAWKIVFLDLLTNLYRFTKTCWHRCRWLSVIKWLLSGFNVIDDCCFSHSVTATGLCCKIYNKSLFMNPDGSWNLCWLVRPLP